ncbi:hypothetical protein [Acinetobacter ursingii]|uniref:hypothetical protein n=1 Tax=Acinetobacter ursingii TaxID=108980 RepID=UPI0012509388|nr:hypothetical protein [Acinetobacter ursingii]
MKEQLSQSKQKITYTFSSDSKSLGQTDAQSPEALDIARKIHNSLQELPSKIVHDTLEQTTKKIEEGLHAEAIELLIQNSFFIFKLKDKRILEVIELIDNANLDKEIRKSHLLFCLGYASFIGELKKVIKYIGLTH